MRTEQFGDAKIVESWNRNALPWTVAVREKRIESRKQVTDRAIVDSILDCSPHSVLDIGCGEGWLVRELAARNIDAVGVDVVPAIIEAAQRAGGDFRVMSYEEIAAGKLGVSGDVVVCNFSLLGKDSVEGLFRASPSLLTSQGSFVVQTVHPAIACGDLPYRDGWREDSWTGFGIDFCDPPPWYFRTMASWIKLFVDSGFRLREVREPLRPDTQKPASVIFVGEAVG